MSEDGVPTAPPRIDAEAVLKALQRGTRDALFVKDARGRYLMVNPRAAEILGLPESEILGRTDDELLAPEMARYLGTRDRGVRESRGFQTVEEHLLIGQRAYTFRTTLGSYEGPGGVGIVGVAQDVTRELADAARREFLGEATEALAKSLDWHETLARVARLAIPRLADFCVVDMVEPSGDVRGVAVAHVEPEKEGLVRQLRERISPGADTPNPAWRVIRSGQTELLAEVDEATILAHTRDAEHASLIRALGVRSHLAVPLRVEGRVTGAISFGLSDRARRYGEEDRVLAEELARRVAQAIERARLHDSERSARRQSERIASQLARLQELTAGLSQALSTLEVGQILVSVGVPVARAISGSVFLRTGDRLSRVYGSGFPPRCTLPVLEFPLSAPLPVARAVLTEQPVVLPTREHFTASFPDLAARLADHAAFVALPLVFGGRVMGGLALGFAGPLEPGDGELELLQGIARQCAQAFERARLFEAEQRARSEAEAADRAKDRFIAMLSHELRNPLSAVMSAMELILRENVPPESRRRGQEVIHRQARQMARMVDDLLDVSRISQGKVHLVREVLDLGALVQDSVRDFSGIAAARPVELTLEPPTQAVFVQGDRTRLAQVLGNLLSNAVKFSAGGGTVRVSVRSEGAQVSVSVRDEGAGIPPEVLPRLFNPFVQADTSLDRQRGGLGLGLAVSKGLIELHGGSISAHSEGPGRGTTVSFLLPAFGQAPGAGKGSAPEGPPQAAGGRRVLLIEDNPDAAEMLLELLRLDGFEVTVATTGTAALSEAAARAPDIILCDVGLPEMDGYEVARALRSRAATMGAFMVALTGYGQEADRTRALESGFDVHLTKPVDLSRLRALLRGRR